MKIFAGVELRNYRTKIFWFGGIFDFREKGKT